MDRTDTATGTEFSHLDRPDDLSGKALGEYELGRLLGIGASARVYAAYDHQRGNRVAVKVLDLGRTGASHIRDRFLDELRIARSLDHPNLLLPYDGGIAGGRVFLVSRFVQAVTLQAVLSNQGPLSLEDCSRVADQLGRALEAVHATGLIHRDVKPSNVLVAGQKGGQHYMLTDLGIAQRLQIGSQRGPTSVGIGTPGFSAPEQVAGQLVDRRADIFSFGCLLYACLVGTPPWSRGTREMTLSAMAEEPPPSVSGPRRGAPRALDRVVARALASEPRSRYRSAGALSAAFERALDDRAESFPAPAPITLCGRQDSGGGNHPHAGMEKPTQVGGAEAGEDRNPEWTRSQGFDVRNRRLADAAGPGSWLVRLAPVWATLAFAGALASSAATTAGLVLGEGSLFAVATLGLAATITAVHRPRTKATYVTASPPTVAVTELNRRLQGLPGWSVEQRAEDSARAVGPGEARNSLLIVALLACGLLPGIAYLISTSLPATIVARTNVRAGATVVTLAGIGTDASDSLRRIIPALASS